MIRNNSSDNKNINITHIIIYVLLLAACLSQPAYASTPHQPSCFNIWIDYPSERLTDMGRSFLSENMADSALVCYSIVAGRYNKDLSVENQKICRDAYYMRWVIYFNKIYDFSKAYENLTKAEEISERIGDTDPEIELGLAYFYETLEDNIQDNSNRIKNIEHSKKAFYAALRNGNIPLLDRAFINYITASYKNGIMDDESAKVYSDYKDFAQKPGAFFKRFNTDLYAAYLLILEKKYSDALGLVEHLHSYVAEKQDADQFRYIARCVQYDIYKGMGDYKSALGCMDEVRQILSRNPKINKRSTLEMYKDVYSCYYELGDMDAYKDNLNKYLLLKDTLLNMKQVTRMGEITFIGEISRMDEVLASMRARTQTHNIIFILMSVIVVIVVVSAFMLYKKNKLLSASNKKLYDNFNELIRAKDKEIEMMLLKTEDGETARKEDMSQKYKDSSLTADAKHDILKRILAVMDNVDEICSTEFSGERLAELSGTSYKNVSQVINEKFECNFNVFLNRYRIEEACRRLTDMDRYGMFTIEALSESVGFKSRTRFASNFKKIVGMSPSDYRKISLERSMENV